MATTHILLLEKALAVLQGLDSDVLANPVSALIAEKPILALGSSLLGSLEDPT